MVGGKSTSDVHLVQMQIIHMKKIELILRMACTARWTNRQAHGPCI